MAMRTGFDQETAVQMVFWLAFGSLAFQLPIGWAADRFNRRKLMTLAAVVALIMPLTIIPNASNQAFVSAAIFVWGGMAVASWSRRVPRSSNGEATLPSRSSTTGTSGARLSTA